MKIESLLRATVRRFRSNMSVNIDYANEYLTRTRHSQLGLLTFFIVDDLFEALNLDATRAVFGAESGYKLNDIHDAETIKEFFMLAENVKLLDTVAEKTIAWYRPRANGLQKTEDFVWNVWSDMQAAEYIRKIKQIFEGFPGRETIPLGLPIKRHKFDPNKTGSVIVVQDRMVRKSNLSYSNNRSRSRQRLRADQDGKRNKSSSSMVVSESCSKGRCHHFPRQSVSTSARINPQSMGEFINCRVAFNLILHFRSRSKLLLHATDPIHTKSSVCSGSLIYPFNSCKRLNKNYSVTNYRGREILFFFNVNRQHP